MKRAGAGEKPVLVTSLTKRCDPLPETLVGHDLENVSSGGSKEAKFLSIDRLSGVQIGMIGVVATAAQTDTDSFGRTTAKFVLTLRIRAASPRYQYSSDHSFWLVADEGLGRLRTDTLHHFSLERLQASACICVGGLSLELFRFESRYGIRCAL
jgi:hypothetical protein